MLLLSGLHVQYSASVFIFCLLHFEHVLLVIICAVLIKLPLVLLKKIILKLGLNQRGNKAIIDNVN